MSWNSSKKKRGNDTPETKDNTVRCKECFVSSGVYGQSDIGTPLVKEIVRLRKEDGPNVDVAHTIRCIQCGVIADVRIWQTGTELGVTRDHVMMLLSATKASPTFTMAELASGEIDRPKFPAHLEHVKPAAAKPTFGQQYNPDLFIEPKQEVPW